MWLLTKPLFRILAFLLAWLVLVTVQIALGMGSVPGRGDSPAGAGTRHLHRLRRPDAPGISPAGAGTT